MADTQWADISEFQTTVNNSYPYPILCIRSNDGGYQDRKFNENRAWCDQAVASGKLAMYIVYYFYRPGMTGFSTLKARVGTPNPKMAVMIDVESDQGRVRGNQSGNINTEFNNAAAWLGDARRVIGYGNTGDLNSLWPQKPPGIRLVVANYSSNPTYPGKFAHQYTDHGACAPFGTCDMNSADGMALNDVLGMFGLGAGPTPAPTPSPSPPATQGGAVSLRRTSTNKGYWVTGSDGGVFTFGDAQFHGSLGDTKLNKPVTDMAPTPDDKGYWMVAEDGGVFSFGSAGFFGSLADEKLNAPIIGIESSKSGKGYWLLGKDGGVFSFGDAKFMGAPTGLVK